MQMLTNREREIKRLNRIENFCNWDNVDEILVDIVTVSTKLIAKHPHKATILTLNMNRVVASAIDTLDNKIYEGFDGVESAVHTQSLTKKQAKDPKFYIMVNYKAIKVLFPDGHSDTYNSSILTKKYFEKFLSILKSVPEIASSDWAVTYKCDEFLQSVLNSVNKTEAIKN